MSSCFGLMSDPAIMETELTRGMGFGSIFGSTVKPRSLRFQPSGLCSVSHHFYFLFTSSLVVDFLLFSY
jgi:hypothetical protein